jgi:hypothetical protein
MSPVRGVPFGCDVGVAGGEAVLCDCVFASSDCIAAIDDAGINLGPARHRSPTVSTRCLKNRRLAIPLHSSRARAPLSKLRAKSMMGPRRRSGILTHPIDLPRRLFPWLSDRRARTSSCTKSIKPTLFDFRGKAVVASNTKGNDPTDFLWRICNEKNLDGSSKYGFVDFHAPTHNNPSIPIRMPVETDEEYAARRQFELIDDLIASNHPLVYQQEHLVESIGAGSRFSISRRCFSTASRSICRSASTACSAR